MDISSVVGLILALGLIIGSMMLGSAPMSAFIDLPSALVVIGGAMAAAMMCFPLSNVLSTPTIMLKVLLNKPADVKGVIEQLVSLAETARRDGLLALESRMDEVTNAFVKLGIQMAVLVISLTSTWPTYITSAISRWKSRSVAKSSL